MASKEAEARAKRLCHSCVRGSPPPFGYCEECDWLAAALDAFRAEGVAAERERCAKVALNEKVDADDTGHESDFAYNQACEAIAAAIREGREARTA